MRQSRGRPAYLMLLFQSLLLALPARPSNSVGVNHCWLCLMQRPLPPEHSTTGALSVAAAHSGTTNVVKRQRLVSNSRFT